MLHGQTVLTNRNTNIKVTSMLLVFLLLLLLLFRSILPVFKFNSLSSLSSLQFVFSFIYRFAQSSTVLQLFYTIHFNTLYVSVCLL